MRGEGDTTDENQTMSAPLTSNPVTPFSALDAGRDVPTNENNGESYDNNNHSEDGSQGAAVEIVGSSYDDEDDDSYGSDNDDDVPLSLDEFLYSVRSYHAIARPVSITMILAALAAVYVNNDAYVEAGAEMFQQSYNVFDLDDSGDHNMKNLAASIANTFIMVLAIGSMTFGIVLLYKYRCMKILIGYMCFSSASLLGLLGDYMGTIGIEIYRIPIDVISWYLFMYNFAIVGVTAIFYQKGIPSGVTQTYLVFTSVILAWHFSHFDDWTAWTLLVMLAFYDLCAVLSPCGPLKALVNLMSEKDSPEMPGLLYEARLPAGTYRPGTSQNGATSSNSTPPSTNENTNGTVARGQESNRNDDDESESSGSCSSEDDGEESEAAESEPVEHWEDNETTPGAGLEESEASTLTRGRTGSIPLAIAKLYTLPLVHEYGTSSSSSARSRLIGLRNRGNTTDDISINTSPLLASETLEQFYQREFTPSELRGDVEVQFPSGGGKVVREKGSHGRKFKYAVYSKTGELRRTLVVDKKGKVFEMSFDNDDESVDDEAGGAIRLGLGDFIFYSVMVAKAAMYSFTTFAACMLVILSGLGGTLVLLSVYHSALPALPISIFLGVIFYLLTKVLIEPWIEEIMTYPLYV